MKIKYEKPEVKKLEFEQCDVLTVSPTSSGGNGMSNNENTGESNGDYNF